MIDYAITRRIGLSLVSVVLLMLSLVSVSHAVRANWGVRQMGPRLEKRGQHEEAAFYYRAGLDFYTAILQLWIGVVYEDGVDEIYQQHKEAFDAENWVGVDHEERWDTIKAYLFRYNRDGASRNVEMGDLSAAQMTRLEDRMRIYIEDLINPDSGFGGDFSFARKAWILEHAGLFWHAAFRRELAGRYAIQVCSRYYAAVADEMEWVFGDHARAKLYRQKSAYWRERGLREFRLCNGDRALSRLKGDHRLKRLDRDEIIAVLEKGLSDKDSDARQTAVQILYDMGKSAILEKAMRNSEEIKAFATEKLRRLPDNQVQEVDDGSKAGSLVEYFRKSDPKMPVAAKVFDTVDIGLKFQANFPKLWYSSDYWPKQEIFPEDAQGPFILKVTTKLYIPADGDYRFYVKGEVTNRVMLAINTLQDDEKEIISPDSDEELRYVIQAGMGTHRIDFSDLVPLKKGLVELAIVYNGEEVRKIHNEHMANISGVQKAGIQLFWSSDRHLMELIPADNLFH